MSSDRREFLERAAAIAAGLTKNTPVGTAPRVLSATGKLISVATRLVSEA